MADGGRRFSLAIIIALVTLGLALAGGISYYIATRIVNDQGTAAKGAVQRGPSLLMKLGDPKDGLIINVGGVNSGRYLKISITLEVKQDKKLQETAGKTQSPEEIKMLDTVIHTLRSLKTDEFEPTKQERLKEIIKQEVNRVLGEERVYEVYITNLVVQ